MQTCKKLHVSIAQLEAEILHFLYLDWLPWKQLKGKQ